MEELDLLLRLQRIDDHRTEMKKREEEIPETIRSLELELTNKERDVEEEEQRIEDDTKRRRMMEIELDASGETVKRYQSQLLDVKSNKEYTALLHEIEGERDKISKLEEEILILMDEIDNLVRDLETSRQRLNEEKRSFEQRKRDLEAELNALNDKIAVKDDERKRVVGQLEPHLVEKYETIRERWGGLVVVALDREVCGGCFTTLPPQFVNEIRKRDRILTCEHCGRILVWKEE